MLSGVSEHQLKSQLGWIVKMFGSWWCKFSWGCRLECLIWLFWNGGLPFLKVQFSSVQSLSCVQLFVTPWITAHQASLSITNSQSLLKPMSIKSVVMPSNHLILCHPFLPLPPIPPNIRVFSNGSALHMRWPKYWSFSFNISPSNEHPGLISFRMDWLELLAVQGTLKSLLQHHSSKASIFQYSAFFTVQLSHPYMTTGKTIALTRRTFVGKVMSLLFNMLSRLVFKGSIILFSVTGMGSQRVGHNGWLSNNNIGNLCYFLKLKEKKFKIPQITRQEFGVSVH